MQVFTPSTAAVQGVAPTSSSSSSATTATVDYNSYLQLLITEMKNQDPTKPLDPTQTVTQLATFSGVQQAVQTNSLLNAMLTNSALSQASALIGRTVTMNDGSPGGVVVSVTTSSTGGSITLDNGATAPLSSVLSVSA